MALRLINTISEISRIQSAEINKGVISNQVVKLQRTFDQITDWKKQISLKFFYRQAEIVLDGERWNIYGRFLWWLCGVYFTNKKRGEIILTHLQTVIDWLRKEDVFTLHRDFWTIESETSELMAKMRVAFVCGNVDEARRIALHIKQNSSELLESMSEKEFLQTK